MKSVAWSQYLAAVLVGLAYSLFSVYFWAYYATDHGFNDWLVATLDEQGQEALYLLAIYSHDFLVNLIIAVPFAIVVANLRPNSYWPYVGMAIFGGFALVNWEALLRVELWSILPGSARALVHYAVFLLPLPIAFLMAIFLRRRAITG